MIGHECGRLTDRFSGSAAPAAALTFAAPGEKPTEEPHADHHK